MPMTSWAPRFAEMKARPQTQAGIERPARKKVVAGAHVTLEGEADPQNEDEIDQHNEPVNNG
jgi:hypothetical protein